MKKRKLLQQIHPKESKNPGHSPNTHTHLPGQTQYTSTNRKAFGCFWVYVAGVYVNHVLDVIFRLADMVLHITIVL